MSQTTPPASPPGARRRLGRVGLMLMLGALTSFGPLSIDMYLPALPRLGAVYGVDAAAVQLTLATFFVGYSLGQTLWGPITDRFGRKPPLYFSLLLFAIASAGCALAPSVEILACWRLLQALGVAAGVVISRAMVRDLFPPSEMAHVFSTLMMVIGVAPILAPLIGGYLLGWFDWEAIFWLLTGLGLLCLLAVTLRLDETHRPAVKPSLRLGVILRSYGSLLADRQYLGFALCGGLSLGGMFAYIAGSPFVLIELKRVPAEAYGWIFGANALGFVAASQMNRRLLKRHGSLALIHDSTLVQALAGLALLAASAFNGGLWTLLPPLFVYVTCIGFILPNTSALAMGPQGHRAGIAAALLGTLQFAMAAVAALSVGALQDGSGLPMGIVVAAGSCGAFLVRRFLVGLPRKG